MRAAFLYVDKAKHMGIEEVTKPVCESSDVLVKVNACAICGTDGRMYEGTKDVTRRFVPQIRGYGEGRFIIG
ncbi:MAG: alcohol dehydrogenase catalytic domain-containing protein, partial [Candidatus Aminicenantes bacterium]|nr:alcohol dehydrogenase catalytic domain-containing protein [Candidatus Aminicenantes bacterium]